MENYACIALGSNIGNRFENLMEAINILTKNGELQLVNSSSIYETDPVGYEDQDLFLNMVIEVKTNLTALALLERCLNTEHGLGRKREIRWGPRTIDLDILTFNQENIETEKLIVPHPRMFERAFVLIPLSEIKPDLEIPGSYGLLKERINELPDREGVRVWKQKNGAGGFEPIES